MGAPLLGKRAFYVY